MPVVVPLVVPVVEVAEPPSLEAEAPSDQHLDRMLWMILPELAVLDELRGLPILQAWLRPPWRPPIPQRMLLLEISVAASCRSSWSVLEAPFVGANCLRWALVIHPGS